MNHPFLWSIGTKILNWLSRFHIYSPTIGYIFPPLGLLTVAANTPSGIEIQFVDERVEEIDFRCPVDLVGISVMTFSAYHAYNIAKRFMQKGVPVILGGIHPSLMPNEAIKYSNSVVIGEVEGLWEDILMDCRNNVSLNIKVDPFVKTKNKKS